METKHLYRAERDKLVFGVCGGLGEYLGISSTIIRLLWVVLCCMGMGVLIYVIAAIFIQLPPLDEEPIVQTERPRRQAVPQAAPVAPVAQQAVPQAAPATQQAAPVAQQPVPQARPAAQQAQSRQTWQTWQTAPAGTVSTGTTAQTAVDHLAQERKG